MKLYTYYQSSASYRVRIALGLKGLDAEMFYINLIKGEQKSQEYVAINPEMIVPTLIDKGHTFSQSLAIMEYLEEAYPSPAILPADVCARAYVRSLSCIIACDTSPLGNLKVRKYLHKELSHNEDEITQWMPYWISEGLAAFEKTLDRSSYAGKFCLGETPTMADCCLIPQVFNAHRWKCDMSHFPLIQAIVKNCEAHPAFIAAHPSQQKDAA